MDKKFVTTGKPAVGGAVFHGPTSANLPTDAVTDLPETMKDLGYCSEDGLTAKPELTVQDIKAWGGQVVDSSETEKKDLYSVTLIEGLNPEVLKYVHGPENVEGTLEDGIAVKAHASEHGYESLVVDMIGKDAVIRHVLPYAKIVKIGEIHYKQGEAVGYQLDIAAYPDADGVPHYEYIKAVTPAAETAGNAGNAGNTGNG